MPRMRTVNKSEMVREMLREMGMDASPTEISHKLTAQGHKISPNMVSGIKIAMKKGKGMRRGRGRRRHAMQNTMTHSEAHPSIEEVYQVWALANQIGNDKLKQIVKHMP